MDAVGVHGLGTQQTKLFVHAQIAARIGVQAFDPSDFVEILRNVGLNPHIRVLCRQFARPA